MSNENDSWLEGIGVCIADFFSSDPDQAGGSCGSDDYNQGYQDGLNGGDSHAIPRANAALEEYEQGYAKGHAEFLQKQPPQPTPTQDPPPQRLVDTGQAYKEGYDDGSSGRIGVCHTNASPEYEASYERGYADGKAASSSSPSNGPQAKPLSDDDYERDKKAMEDEEQRQRDLERLLDLKKEWEQENPEHILEGNTPEVPPPPVMPVGD